MVEIVWERELCDAIYLLTIESPGVLMKFVVMNVANMLPGSNIVAVFRKTPCYWRQGPRMSLKNNVGPNYH